MTVTGDVLDEVAPDEAPAHPLLDIVGVVVLAVAAIYGVLVLLGSIALTLMIRSDFAETRVVAFAAFDGLHLVTLPASLLGPGTLLDGASITSTGFVLCLLGLAQAALLAAIGWALLHPGRTRVVVAVVVVAALVSIAALRHDTALVLPNRSDPAVQAEEARLAQLVDKSDGFRTGAVCRVRLLKQEGSTSYVNAYCEANEFGRLVVPARIDGDRATLVHSEDDSAEYYASLLPPDVRRALVDQWDATQP